jgi:hypothetical protein
MDPEALYIQLGHLVAEMPVLTIGPVTADTNRWLGRAAHLVEECGDIGDTVGIKSASR